MFWLNLESFYDRIAVVEDKQQLTYRQLVKKCDELFAKMENEKQLVFVVASNNIVGLVGYLACLRYGHLAMLIDPELDEQKLQALIALYRPNLLVRNNQATKVSSKLHNIDDQAALLLSTSGSTGTAKQVVLSYENLQANADSICSYLPIEATDKALSTLPLFYSYGLSVLNSHLNRGATIVFTKYSFVNREFWQMFKQESINSFAGVPHSYDMLLRLRFTRMILPSLRYFTQAGGRLAAEKASLLADYAQQNDKDFFVMYGQTEATARMAFLPTKSVLLKPGAIGKAIPQGYFELRAENGTKVTEIKETGELYYTGPNVMLGYAQGPEDLTRFETLSWLATGDIGFFDEDGDYYIVGRRKRLIKIFGMRIGLDEVEELLLKKGLESYCCGKDNKLLVALSHCNDIKKVKADLSEELKLHSSVINVITMQSLPLTANGKKDYMSVMRQAGFVNE